MLDSQDTAVRSEVESGSCHVVLVTGSSSWKTLALFRVRKIRLVGMRVRVSSSHFRWEDTRLESGFAFAKENGAYGNLVDSKLEREELLSHDFA